MQARRDNARVSDTRVQTEAWTERREDRVASQALIATSARVVFILLAVTGVASLARVVVLPVLLAWFASMMLRTPTQWLQRACFPAPLAAALVVAIFVSATGFAVLNLGRPAMEWLASAPEELPRLKLKFQRALRPVIRLSEATASMGSLGSAEAAGSAPQQVEVKSSPLGKNLFTWTGSMLAGIGETIALIFLFLAYGDVFLHKLLRSKVALRHQKPAIEISHEIPHHISTYLFSVGLINLGLGLAVGLVLWLLELPNPLMWGGVVAFANFVPYLGPILGIMAVGLAGLLSFDTIGRALLPAGAYCGLHLIEANVITPIILGRRSALNPAVIFVALMFFLWLWGVLGALLAVPILVTIKVISEHMPALNLVGELLTSDDSGQPHASSGHQCSPPKTGGDVNVRRIKSWFRRRHPEAELDEKAARQ